MVVSLFSSIFLNAQVVNMEWNTFLGSSNDDFGLAFTRDRLGNTYVTGYGYATWGSPINAFTGNSDAFVACLDSSGNLLWNTFLGSSQDDCGYGIARDISGHLYLTGYSDATWGSPINAFTGNSDAFVACLDSSGNLLWNTFLGSDQPDFGYGIVLDGSKTVYVTGVSWATWGSPVNAFSGSADSFVARLDSAGNLLGNTFFGSHSTDECFDVALDSSGHIYVIGYSLASWGSPVNAHSGDWDAYIASLDSSGNILWNTFLGSGTSDFGLAITLNDSDNIYVTGYSFATWGSPMNAHSGCSDAFVAVLDSSGGLLWNSFIGSSCDDSGYGITLDNSGNIYVTGSSKACWGSPVYAHCGDWDAYIVSLDSSGSMLWNTFLGSESCDFGLDIAIDDSEKIQVFGYSNNCWGSPLRNHNGNWDLFAVTLSAHPSADITANGSDGPLSIAKSETLQIRVSLNTIGLTDDADFWLFCKTPSRYIHYNEATNSWEPGQKVTHQGALFDMNNKKVFQSSKLSPGTYRFFFGVDMKMDGEVSVSCLYYDEIKVTVTSN